MSEASAHVKILTECGGINRGDIPRGGAPRDVPEVDPDTRGGIERALEHMSECIINTTQT